MHEIHHTRLLRDLDGYLSRISAGTAFGESLGEDMASRRILGKYIAKRVPLAPTLILDAGTTSYAITDALVEEKRSGLKRVITTNLAIALQLSLHKAWSCMLLGGSVDFQHFCTLPDEKMLPEISSPEQMGGVVTAAAVKIAEGRIVLRARRPDQFPFKRWLFSSVATPVLAFEADKMTKPFDGVHELPIDRGGITVVVSGGTLLPETARSNLLEACANAGHDLQFIVAG